MSRVGKIPVPVPQGIQVILEGSRVKLTGPKGNLEVELPENVEVKMEDGKMKVASSRGNLQGLTKSMLANAVHGVSQGWSKVLELNGTGFRAVTSGGQLQLALGFSHPVVIPAIQGIGFEVKENKITVTGADKVLVGQVAAKIKALKPVDPYKAKGFKYEGEYVIKKAGKAAKAGGAK